MGGLASMRLSKPCMRDVVWETNAAIRALPGYRETSVCQQEHLKAMLGHDVVSDLLTFARSCHSGIEVFNRLRENVKKKIRARPKGPLHMLESTGQLLLVSFARCIASAVYLCSGWTCEARSTVRAATWKLAAPRLALVEALPEHDRKHVLEPAPVVLPLWIELEESRLLEDYVQTMRSHNVPSSHEAQHGACCPVPTPLRTHLRTGPPVITKSSGRTKPFSCQACQMLKKVRD
jgi:hypothetical protein